MSLSHKNPNPDAPNHQRVPKVHQAKVETPDGDFNTPFQRLKGRRLTTRLSSLIPLSSYEPSTRSRFKLHFAITTERLLTKTTKTSLFLQSRRFRTPNQEGVSVHPCPLRSPLWPKPFKSIKKTAIHGQIRTLVPSNLVIRDILRSAHDPVIIQHYRGNRMVAPPRWKN